MRQLNASTVRGVVLAVGAGLVACSGVVIERSAHAWGADPQQIARGDDRDHDDDRDRDDDRHHDDRRPRRRSATRSSPIAITSDDRFVWSVNPDNNSVSVFKVAFDANRKVAEIAVGREPWCVAITPDDEKAFVTNMASGTVSVISTEKRKVVDTIKVGAEPFGCALTPDGRKLYVTNQSSNTVSVIDTYPTGSSEPSGTSAASRTASPSPATAEGCS
jgi:YVTN family beta-propeller protein